MEAAPPLILLWFEYSALQQRNTYPSSLFSHSRTSGVGGRGTRVGNVSGNWAVNVAGLLIGRFLLLSSPLLAFGCISALPLHLLPLTHNSQVPRDKNVVWVHFWVVQPSGSPTIACVTPHSSWLSGYVVLKPLTPASTHFSITSQVRVRFRTRFT